jgi:flagellar FliJ protein
MKKFKFRLQRVLETKESEERQKKRELGEKQNLLAQEEAVLTQLLAQIDDHEQKQRHSIEVSSNAGDLLRQHRWQLELNKQKKQQLHNINKCEKEVEKARLALVEATREKRVLEKLKEKQLEEYKKYLTAEEQKVLDDVGARNHSSSINSENSKFDR